MMPSSHGVVITYFKRHQRRPLVAESQWTATLTCLLAIALLSAACGCKCTRITRSAAAATPANPGKGYLLDWEHEASRQIPPPPWAVEYDPTPGHADQEPQIRFSDQALNEPVRAGQWSVRFQLEPGDDDDDSTDDHVGFGGARTEFSSAATDQDFEPYGAERWYGFSVWLEDWPEDQPREAEIVTQWHQAWDGPEGSPPLAIITEDGKWKISQRDFSDLGANNTIHTPVDQKHYESRRWVDWVVHVKWSATRNGRIEIWKDGRRVFTKSGPNTFASYGNYIKFGVYKWGWGGSRTTGVSRRVMYYDSLRIAGKNACRKAVSP